MKPASPRRGLLSHLLSVPARLSLGILAFGWFGQAFAEAPATGVLMHIPISAPAESDADDVTDESESGSVPALMAGLGMALLFCRRR